MRTEISFAAREWAGAFGDLGVSAPVLLALSAAGSLDLARALLLFGLTYIAAGLYFRVPLPVQPLKAATAVVLARGLDGWALRACSLWIAAILLALSLTGLSAKLNRLFTRTIVRGLQLGLGLLLLRAAWKLGFAAAPAAGGVLAAQAGLPPAAALWPALWVLVVPQLPLTLGNSVAATCDACRGYFGGRAERVDAKRVSVSIALANLAAALFGGLPVCHGSGGVTAHRTFGARTAGATIIAGSAFVLLSLLLGSAGAGAALRAIPGGLLAAMLAYTGLMHARLAWDKDAELRVAAAMGAVGLLTNNLSYALAAGLALEYAGRLYRGSATPRT